MKVPTLLRSIPGVSKARAKRVLERAGIEEWRRVGSLTSGERRTLSRAFFALQARGKEYSPEVGGNTGEMPDEISVVIYLDTDDAQTIAQVVQNVDELVAALGYDDPLNAAIERGSYFSQAWSSLKKALTSDEINELKLKTERALELSYLDGKQADYDNKIADAISKLITSLQDVPVACAVAGSVLLIKYPGVQGPILHTRVLSQLEMAALQKFPQIQRDPRTLLEQLDFVISDLGETGPQQGQL